MRIRIARAWAVTAVLLLVVASAGVGQSPGSSPGASADPTMGHLWQDATASTIGSTGEWTNKVEVADINGDGLLDILHANGGDYDTPGELARQGVFLNQGAGEAFLDVTDDVFGDGRYHARVIKARDVTGDDIVDLLVGTTYESQSRFLRGLGDGAFEDQTELLLPKGALSVGDLEVGDVDGDGATDIVLADWGPGSPMSNAGGPVRLWRNNLEGWTQDDAAMPTLPIRFSWDLELVDVDLDWDLDVVVSCKMCSTSRLYLNDGSGTFSDATSKGLPAFGNNYEFEAMDLDGDADPELVTINDGPSGPYGFTEHVFRNDVGTFTDVTAEWWSDSENPGYDDNMVAFLDVESDGDADFLIGSLDGPDRLLLNDGSGHLTMESSVFDGPSTPGTLGIALGDLDGDGRMDVVEGEGEVADADHVFLGTDALPVDTAAPVIDAVDVVGGEPGMVEVRARIHDRKSPVMPDDFSRVTVRLGASGAAEEHPLVWYGDALWRAVFESDDPLPTADAVTICATDRAGNVACRP